MKNFKIAVYPGDGIGPEVVQETVRILEVIENRVGGFKLDLTWLPWGVDFADKTGMVAPENFLEILRPYDAIFLGAVGDPGRLPDAVTLRPLVRLRQSFDQYACLRPARLYEGVQSPLASRSSHKIDLLVVRENSEGEYVDMGGRFKRGQPDEVALQVATHSRRGIERILRFGFNLAKTRKRRLMMVTKSNALQFAFGLWEEILAEVSKDFPDVEAEKQNADAAAMNFVRHPERFDVVVASNLFGDILTDLAGVVSGGLGLSPSANLNPREEIPFVVRASAWLRT